MDQNDTVLFKARALLITEAELDISRKHQQAEVMARLDREHNLARMKLANGESGALKHPLAVRVTHVFCVAAFRELIAEASLTSPLATMFLVGFDGTKLAYRVFMPRQEPTAVLVLPSHIYLRFNRACAELTSKFSIMVALVDLRGYGQSGGKRATSGERKDLWRDLRTVVKHFKLNNPMLPIFLGGFFRNGGAVLNYSTWAHREPVDGYVFLAPDQGKSDCFNPEGFKAFHKDVSFKINWGSMAVGYLTGGYLNGQSPAYEFRYPESMARSAPVGNIGINDVLATRPVDARRQFAAIDVPFGFWIGSEDEFFFPEKAIEAPQLAKVPGCEIKIIEGARHYTLMDEVIEPLGKWLTEQAETCKKETPPGLHTCPPLLSPVSLLCPIRLFGGNAAGSAAEYRV